MLQSERPSSYHFISFGKKTRNLLAALQSEYIGSKHQSISQYISKGAKVLLHCRGRIVGSGTIVSDYEYCEDRIWTDNVYPHRFRFRLERLVSEPFGLGSNGNQFNVEFQRRFGKAWAYKLIFVPQPIPEDLGVKIEEVVMKIRPLMDFSEIEACL